MRVQILFVCPDPYFAELFTNYTSSSQHEFSLSCFTDREKAFALYQEKPESFQAILAPQTVLAQYGDSSALRICLADFTQCRESAGELQQLNIYQQRRDALADLQLILNTHLGISKPQRNNGHTRVLSFFSTQGGAGKSTLAYLTALRAAQSGKTAYLTLAPVPCPELLYPQAQASVSGEELLYAIRDRQDPVKSILPALVHNPNDVYVLPTSQSLQDLLELSAEDWEFLLNALLQQGGMDHIILDLGSELSPVNRMAFDHSNLAVLVYTNDKVGQGKRDRFLQDPNFAQFGLACPYLEARNKCRQKLAATDAVVPFPFSKTLDSGESPSIALSGNSDLYDACSQILQAAEREG